MTTKSFSGQKGILSIVLAVVIMGSMFAMQPMQQAFAAGSTIVTTTSPQSPQTTDDYEGERRVFTINGIIFAFYFDGSNIVYKKSSDNSQTWGSATSTGSGIIAADKVRWTIARSDLSNGQKYVVVLYWQLSGSNHNFYAIRGTINSTSATISWSSPILLGYTATSNCTGNNDGACAAAVAATDSNGVIYAAFRWISGGASTYSYQIKKSSDGGLNWVDSLAQVNGASANRIDMTLTRLNNTKMLFVYAKYESSELNYRVFDGSAWGSVQTTSGAGMNVNQKKQISSDSNSTSFAFVAFVTGGTSGTLKVARFSNTGTFQAFETVDSTQSHSFPTVTADPKDNILVYSIAGGKVLHTKRLGDDRYTTLNAVYGDAFNSPDQLTAGVWYGGTIWREGTSSPYTLRYSGIIPQGYVLPCPGSYSPSNPCVWLVPASDPTYRLTIPVDGITSACVGGGGGNCLFGDWRFEKRILVHFPLGDRYDAGGNYYWISCDPLHPGLCHADTVGIGYGEDQTLVLNNVLEGVPFYMTVQERYTGGSFLGIDLPDTWTTIDIYMPLGMTAP